MSRESWVWENGKGFRERRLRLRNSEFRDKGKGLGWLQGRRWKKFTVAAMIEDYKMLVSGSIAVSFS